MRAAVGFLALVLVLGPIDTAAFAQAMWLETRSSDAIVVNAHREKSVPDGGIRADIALANRGGLWYYVTVEASGAGPFCPTFLLGPQNAVFFRDVLFSNSRGRGGSVKFRADRNQFAVDLAVVQDVLYRVFFKRPIDPTIFQCDSKTWKRWQRFVGSLASHESTIRAVIKQFANRSWEQGWRLLYQWFRDNPDVVRAHRDFLSSNLEKLHIGAEQVFEFAGFLLNLVDFADTFKQSLMSINLLIRMATGPQAGEAMVALVPAPTLAVVTVQPTAGPPGTVFVTIWRGFAPNSTLRSRLRKPDRSEFPPLVLRTDRAGTARHSVDSKGFQPGRYELWGVDEGTGRSTARVAFTVLKAEPHGPAGGVAVTGSVTVYRLVETGQDFSVLIAEDKILEGQIHSLSTVFLGREAQQIARQHILNTVRSFVIYSQNTLEEVGSLEVQRIGVCPAFPGGTDSCTPESEPDPTFGNLIAGFGSIRWSRQPDFSRGLQLYGGSPIPCVAPVPGGCEKVVKQVLRFRAASRGACDALRSVIKKDWTGMWVFERSAWLARPCGIRR